MSDEDPKGIGEQFCDQRDDVHAGISQGEELVDAGTKEDEYLSNAKSACGWQQQPAWMPSQVKNTHDPEEPGPKGVDRYLGVICLRNDSPDSRERARVCVPIALDIILADDPRQVNLELGKMAIAEIGFRSVVDAMNPLFGHHLSGLGDGLRALASGPHGALLVVHACHVNNDERACM